MAHFSGSLTLAVMMGASAGAAFAHPLELQTFKTETTYPSESPEALQVRKWLTEHAISTSGDAVGDINVLGDVRVARTLSQASAKAVRPEGVALLPLPASGRPGDSIAIVSTSGQGIQSWTYLWEPDDNGGTWHLQSYNRKLSESPDS